MAVHMESAQPNKEHYQRSKGKAEKSYDVWRHIRIAYVKIQKKEDLQSIMWNLQPNCCLKVEFQKVENIQEVSG